MPGLKPIVGGNVMERKAELGWVRGQNEAQQCRRKVRSSMMTNISAVRNSLSTYCLVINRSLGLQIYCPQSTTMNGSVTID